MTACLTPTHGIGDKTSRQKTYEACIQENIRLCNGLPIRLVVVENSGLTSSFLDSCGVQVIYTNNNTTRNDNKGINELMDVHEVIRQLNMEPWDMVIKLTGRYHFLSDIFLTRVVHGLCDYDAFVKFFCVCKKVFGQNESVLGCFAMRVCILQSFTYKTSRTPQISGISGEAEFATFVRTNIRPARICEVVDLGVRCCFSGDLSIIDV